MVHNTSYTTSLDHVEYIYLILNRLSLGLAFRFLQILKTFYHNLKIRQTQTSFNSTNLHKIKSNQIRKINTFWFNASYFLIALHTTWDSILIFIPLLIHNFYNNHQHYDKGQKYNIFYH